MEHEHSEGCGCSGSGHPEEMTLVLELDDETLECEILSIFETNGKEYVALSPLESEDILIYGYKESDDEGFELVDIDDEDEFQSVAAVLDELLADE